MKAAQKIHEPASAKFQGKHVARIADRLSVA